MHRVDRRQVAEVEAVAARKEEREKNNKYLLSVRRDAQFSRHTRANACAFGIQLSVQEDDADEKSVDNDDDGSSDASGSSSSSLARRLFPLPPRTCACAHDAPGPGIDALRPLRPGKDHFQWQQQRLWWWWQQIYGVALSIERARYTKIYSNIFIQRCMLQCAVYIL